MPDNDKAVARPPDPARAGMDDFLKERIPFTCLVLSFIFLGYAFIDTWMLAAPASRYTSAIQIVVAIAYFALWRTTPRAPAAAANAMVAFIAFLALISSFSSMVLLKDGHLSVNLLLIVFTCSVFFTSRAWFSLVAGMVLCGWFALPWLRGSVSIYYSVALSNGVLLAFVIHECSRRSLRNIQLLKLKSQEQVAEVECASQQAREASTFFRAVLEGTGDPVYVKDTQGRYVMVNQAYLHVTGYAREEIIGRTAADLFGPKDGDMIARNEQNVLATGETRTVEVTLRRLKRTFLANMSPYVNRDGAIAGVIGTSRDITVRKKAEEELAEVVRQHEFAKSQAEAAARAKSEFLACMSHEIRTPMNGVLGMSDLLLDSALDDTQREYATAIHDSAAALLSVINDILDFSKIEAGKMDIDPVAFSLSEHIRSTIAMIEPNARAKGLAFDAFIQPGLPSEVITDPTRLRQIVLNLLGNALKFTDSGRITLIVTAFSEAHGQWRLRMAVRDTGIGIEPDKIRKIFEQFAQADSSTTRRYGGTGLGLTISQRLARLMGGEIGVESAAQQGSTFWLEIPVSLPANNHVPQRSSNGSAAALFKASQDTELSGLRVLLAEDNAVNQKLVLTLLRKSGCYADLATDGNQAIDMAVSNSYDIILMDCEMPNKNGFDATREILDRTPASKTGADTPVVIALTAHAMEGYEQKCLDAGMKGYLTKPLNKHLLLSTLKQFAPAFVGSDH